MLAIKYCSNTVSKNYQINLKGFQQVLSSMKNNGAPRPDNITANVKKGYLAHIHFLQKLLLLLDAAKNHRLIACLNIPCKLYTSLRNTIIENHCTINNIITAEQAAGRKHSQGCTDQLLINKTVLDQTKNDEKTCL